MTYLILLMIAVAWGFLVAGLAEKHTWSRAYELGFLLAGAIAIGLVARG